MECCVVWPLPLKFPERLATSILASQPVRFQKEHHTHARTILFLGRLWCRSLNTKELPQSPESHRYSFSDSHLHCNHHPYIRKQSAEFSAAPWFVNRLLRGNGYRILISYRVLLKVSVLLN